MGPGLHVPRAVSAACPQIPAASLAAMYSTPTTIPLPRALPLQAGKVPDSEMFRTFNMGVGMIIVVPRSDVDKILGLGIGAFELGEIVQGSGVELV